MARTGNMTVKCWLCLTVILARADRNAGQESLEYTPIMDGKEATIALRKKYSNQALKIIALTANITEEEINYYNDIGMDGHLGKPYELIKIKELLSEYYKLS